MRFHAIDGRRACLGTAASITVAAALAWRPGSKLRRLAWLLDGAMRLPETRFRFGLNSVIGVAPAAGDTLLALVSLYIVYEAHKLGLPKQKLNRMLANVGIEALGGIVPIAGDLFDMAFKANLRNIAIIERHFGLGAR